MQLKSEILLNESARSRTGSGLIKVLEEAGEQPCNTTKPYIFERQSVTQTNG